jgi:hypothetical protein
MQRLLASVVLLALATACKTDAPAPEQSWSLRERGDTWEVSGRGTGSIEPAGINQGRPEFGCEGGEFTFVLARESDTLSLLYTLRQCFNPGGIEFKSVQKWKLEIAEDQTLWCRDRTSESGRRKIGLLRQDGFELKFIGASCENVSGLNDAEMDLRFRGSSASLLQTISITNDGEVEIHRADFTELAQ